MRFSSWRFWCYQASFLFFWESKERLRYLYTVKHFKTQMVFRYPFDLSTPIQNLGATTIITVNKPSQMDHQGLQNCGLFPSTGVTEVCVLASAIQQFVHFPTTSLSTWIIDNNSDVQACNMLHAYCLHAYSKPNKMALYFTESLTEETKRTNLLASCFTRIVEFTFKNTRLTRIILLCTCLYVYI